MMLSPGVKVKEIDLTNSISGSSSSKAAYVGPFRWGPVNEINTVSSRKELAEFYGNPNAFTAESFFTADSFLNYGKNLKVVRSSGDELLNASANRFGEEFGNTPRLIETELGFQGLDSLSTDISIDTVFARYPGSLGNSIKVEVFTAECYEEGFVVPEGMSNAKSTFRRSPEANECHILITDSAGLFTGAVGAVLEQWEYLGRYDGDKKYDGSNNYYVDVLNRYSKYVYINPINQSGSLLWMLDTPALEVLDVLVNQQIPYDFSITENEPTYPAFEEIDYTEYLGNFGPLVMQLSGGVDQTSVVPAHIMNGIDLFREVDQVDIDLLFAFNDNDADNTIAEYLISTVEYRGDAIAFCSPPVEDSILKDSSDKIVEWADTIRSSSYAVIDSSALKVYNPYGDKDLWIPAAGHVAGLCAHTDEVADPWVSPAGMTRGHLKNVKKLAFNPKKFDRDELYESRVLPITFNPKDGMVLFGDKTALSRPSAFDRINVRRLFIYLRKAIAESAKYRMFEINNRATRTLFRTEVEAFLRTVRGRRGIIDFNVVCDETNNPGHVVDDNEFIADIYIKPSKSINFINLNFVATRTGVEFSDLF